DLSLQQQVIAGPFLLGDLFQRAQRRRRSFQEENCDREIQVRSGCLNRGAQQKLLCHGILLETQQKAAGLMPDSALRIQREQAAKFRRSLFAGTLCQKQTGQAELQLRVIRVGTSLPAKTLDFTLAALPW